MNTPTITPIGLEKMFWILAGKRTIIIDLNDMIESWPESNDDYDHRYIQSSLSCWLELQQSKYNKKPDWYLIATNLSNKSINSPTDQPTNQPTNQHHRPTYLVLCNNFMILINQQNAPNPNPGDQHRQPKSKSLPITSNNPDWRLGLCIVCLHSSLLFNIVDYYRPTTNRQPIDNQQVDFIIIWIVCLLCVWLCVCVCLCARY